MTREELISMGITCIGGKVYHSGKRRTSQLKRVVQNVKDNPYYFFKHEGRTYAIREEVIFKAFKEKQND